MSLSRTKTAALADRVVRILGGRMLEKCSCMERGRCYVDAEFGPLEGSGRVVFAFIPPKHQTPARAKYTKRARG